jgi:hypothetical protein
MNREFQIYRWSATATEDEVAAGFAEAVGMNYDPELHVVYMGEDKNNGFQMVANGASFGYLVVRPWCNGAVLSNNGWYSTSSGENQRTLTYIVNDDKTAVAFGPSVSEIRSMASKATHADGSEGYMYMMTSGMGNSFQGCYGENISAGLFGQGSLLIASNSLLGLVPMALPQESSLVSDETYIKVIGNNTEGATVKFVSSNGEDYLLCNGLNIGYSQPVLHLGKS